MRSLLIALLAAGPLVIAQPADQSTEAPPGARLLLEVKGQGAQVYTCANAQWVLKAPDAELLNTQGQVIGTHFAGPTWKLNDGSQVRGRLIASRQAPDGKSVPWLLLEAVPGTGSGRFAAVGYVRRTETSGGVAPKEACTAGGLRVSYTAKYSFYASK